MGVISLDWERERMDSKNRGGFKDSKPLDHNDRERSESEIATIKKGKGEKNWGGHHLKGKKE